MRASTQHLQIVFGLFKAFSIILRGYLAFASVKMPPKKRRGRVRFRHRNRERKRNRRASLTKNGPQNWQRAIRSWIFRKAKMLQLLLQNLAWRTRWKKPIKLIDSICGWNVENNRRSSYRIERKKLLERLDESVSCRFCQGRVQVMENVTTKHGLGSCLLYTSDAADE